MRMKSRKNNTDKDVDFIGTSNPNKEDRLKEDDLINLALLDDNKHPLYEGGYGAYKNGGLDHKYLNKI